ncbi:MAG: hypothetical protein Q8L27_01475 [archaeon]|nr:hypothetical protein [archaeon]
MENYVCLNCKFKFKTNGHSNDCPYCGKTTTEKEQTASDLVSEVESLLKD